MHWKKKHKEKKNEEELGNLEEEREKRQFSFSSFLKLDPYIVEKKAFSTFAAKSSFFKSSCMSDPISTMLLKEHQIQFVNAKVNAGYLSSEYLLTFKRRKICILRILELLKI